jgi:hypothetical protein
VLAATLGFLQWLAVKNNLYWTVNEFDSLMHFLGGAMVGMGFIYFFYSSGLFRPEPSSITLWGFLRIAFLGTVFIAVAWEIYELLSGTALAGENNYFKDTTLDFVMDGLGGFTACLYAFYREVSLEKEEQKEIK